MKVSLTIDVEQDCPPFFDTYRGIEEGLPRLLALLEEEKVPATFFTTGDVASRFPGAVAKIVEGGHELGCHGLTHRRFDQMDEASARHEIEESTSILRKFYPVISFRAPNLQFPENYLNLLEKEGYRLDSSQGKHKISYPFQKKYSGSLKRIPASTTSSVLRLPAWIKNRFFHRLKNPIVLFVHPWEFVDLTKERLRLDCRFKTGQPALDCLKETLDFFRAKKGEFCRMEDLLA
ncbi:MAG: polysaccharide deacetylase family protein [bacterium]